MIDAAGHPEISDLARVHAIEGVGDIETHASLLALDDDHRVSGSAEHLLALAVVISVPVRIAFVVTFLIPAHLPVLQDAAGAGHLVIATTDPQRAGSDHPLWLAVDLDARSLSDVLASVGRPS